MQIEIEGTCPLGSKCTEIRDNKLYRCNWLVTISGVNPQTNEKLPDESKCSMAWIPIILLENNKDIRGVQEATESFRNEMVKNNDFMGIINPLQQLLTNK